MSRNISGTRTSASRGAAGDQALAVYLELRSRPDADLDTVAAELALPPAERDRVRAELTALGLIDAERETDAETEPDASAGAVVDPDIALLRLLRHERDRLTERLAETSRAHATLEALAGPFLRAEAEAAPSPEAEEVTDPRRVRRELAALAGTVRDAVHTMHAGAAQREDLAAELTQDRVLRDRGVRVRAMYSSRADSVPEMAQHLADRAALGVEIRLSPVVPLSMVLADENFALVPGDPDAPEAGMVLARGPALVRSYLALYENCWQSATPYGLDEDPAARHCGFDDQQLAALRMLASGLKDGEIAKSMGVSLRTVSRLLSEVMQELRAASRFEAGVKAARRGLLDGETPVGGTADATA